MYLSKISVCSHFSVTVVYRETLLSTSADNCLEPGLIYVLCDSWVFILNGSSKIVITGTSTVKGGHNEHARPVWAGLI